MLRVYEERARLSYKLPDSELKATFKSYGDFLE